MSTTIARLTGLWRDSGCDERFAAALEEAPARATRITELRAAVKTEADRRRRELADRIVSGEAAVDELLAPVDVDGALALIDQVRDRVIDADVWRLVAERDPIRADIEAADREITGKSTTLAAKIGDATTAEQALDVGPTAAAAWSELRRLAARRVALRQLARLLVRELTARKYDVGTWAGGAGPALPRKPASDVDGLLLELGIDQKATVNA
jgi:hypothetical protein